MGLADRDYMRARARSRGHARTQASRHAAGRDRIVAIARVAIPVLCLLTYLVPMYGYMKRGGWMPDWKPALPFPESGSVTVARDLSRKRVSSHLAVQTSDANAVVQLFDPDTGDHALSIYVAGNDRVEVPVPRGTWRVRLVEGSKWHGPADYFGPNTSYETVVNLMTFDKGWHHRIDLRRRPDGNLPTRLMVSGPEPLK